MLIYQYAYYDMNVVTELCHCHVVPPSTARCLCRRRSRRFSVPESQFRTRLYHVVATNPSFWLHQSTSRRAVFYHGEDQSNLESVNLNFSSPLNGNDKLGKENDNSFTIVFSLFRTTSNQIKTYHLKSINDFMTNAKFVTFFLHRNIVIETLNKFSMKKNPKNFAMYWQQYKYNYLNISWRENICAASVCPLIRSPPRTRSVKLMAKMLHDSLQHTFSMDYLDISTFHNLYLGVMINVIHGELLWQDTALINISFVDQHGT